MASSNALITGCSSGVGMHTALLLAQEGYQVYATMRDLKKSDKLVELAKPFQKNIEILPLDVQDEQSIALAAEHIIARDQKIDVLINNAGYGFVRNLEQASMKEIQDVLDVNYYGVVRCMRAVLPHMRKAKAGHVVTLSSVGGLVGQPMNEIYCSAKFAVEGLVESLATYMEPFFNVRMSLIEPGGIKTEFVNRVMGDVQKTGGVYKDDYEPVLNAYLQTMQTRGTFEQRAQTPQEVASVILKCLRAQPGQLRYQTSAYAQEFANLKIASDPTGNFLQQQIRQDLLGLQ